MLENYDPDAIRHVGDLLLISGRPQARFGRIGER